MKKESLSTVALRVVLALGCLGFLSLLTLQINNMESRMVQLGIQNDQIQGNLSKLQLSLRQMEDRIRASGVEARDGTQTAARGAIVSLNPGSPNFLDGLPPEPAPADANMEGHYHKVYGFVGADPKGMNFLLENAADVSEDIREYVNPSLGLRSSRDPSRFYGVLADRIEITDDFREYTIYLKDGLKWHKPVVDYSNPRYEWLKKDQFVTADDFKYTIDLIMDPMVQASHLANYYQDIEYVKVVNDRVFIIRWKKKTYQSVNFTIGLWPTPKWLYANDEDGRAFPKETAGLKFNEHWYNNRAIGCGPYAFVRWEPGVAIVLQRFDEWIGELPPIKNITYHLIQDKNQQLLRFQSGVLDIHELPVSQYREKILDSLESSPYRNGDYQVNSVNEMVYRYIGWNMDHYLFEDKRVRTAMTHAMNRKQIIKNVLHDLATLTTGNFFRFSPAYDNTIVAHDYDLGKAARLLDEAGWKDTDGDGVRDKMINGELKRFEFPMLVYGHRPEIRSWATIFKEDLYKIGVVCNLQATEWSVMLKKMEEREFVSFTGGWGLDFDGDPYQIWHSSQADLPKSSNRIGFRNKEADQIIELLRETFDPEERIRLQHKFHKILHEEQPYLFMYSEKSVYVNQPRLKNVNFQPFRPHVKTLNWYLQP
ncbi:MAG: hypothetical protein H3C47_00195 [Candidatus Cloacimonetes bacterium]|nr:hypothetical protein [Candidatus Cloacimonadota bacterium]